MSIVCMTGWQQPKDALSVIAPDALHFDYAAYDTVEAMFAALPPAPALAVGWSLGGQLLVRAVAGGHMKPQALMLLGAPFQYIADEHFPHGVPAATACQYRDSYRRAPHETNAQFQSHIGYGDRFAARIIRALSHSPKVWENGVFWLDELGKTSCRTFDFSKFPKTVIVHGREDKVIHPASAEAFASRIAHTELLVWPDCAHAPHMHDPDAIQKMVRKHV